MDSPYPAPDGTPMAWGEQPLVDGDARLVDYDGQRWMLLTDYFRSCDAHLQSVWFAAEREEEQAARASGGEDAVSALLQERYRSKNPMRPWGGLPPSEWVLELDGEGVPTPYDY